MGRFTKKQIVSRLLAIVENNDFWPCYYSCHSRYDDFYVHGNTDALEILVRNGLQVGTLENDVSFVLNLFMNVAPHQTGQVDINKKITQICSEMANKTLFLNNLASNPIFKNVVIDMSAPRVVSQILLMASRKVGGTCTHLDLSCNEIPSASGMYPLVWFTKLVHLDISRNKIDSFEKLQGLPQGNKITSVKLTGNPLCMDMNLNRYIAGVKHFFPELEKLDGRTMDTSPLMMCRQNYLCRPECYAFVETFVKHFFRDYDSSTRLLLKELYAPRAQFTISCNFTESSTKTKDQYNRLSKYMGRSRNINKIINISLYTKNVYVGSEEILRNINSLHTTEHDFYSFNIDCPSYSSDKIYIIVNGIFKDKPMTLLEEELLIDFTRSFYLKAVNTGMGVSENSTQYQIFNDLLTVKNITINQRVSAFKTTAPISLMEEGEENAENEKEGLIAVFQEMTGLNLTWCQRCLTEAKWNLKVSLKICVKLMEDDKIPDDAFL